MIRAGFGLSWSVYLSPCLFVYDVAGLCDQKSLKVKSLAIAPRWLACRSVMRAVED